MTARQVSKRQFPTVAEAPPTTSPSNATHGKCTHAGQTAANAFHSPRAMLAFDGQQLSPIVLTDNQPVSLVCRSLRRGMAHRAADPPGRHVDFDGYATQPSTREDFRRGSPREPGRSVHFSARPPRDHGRAPVAHFLGKLPRTSRLRSERHSRGMSSPSTQSRHDQTFPTTKPDVCSVYHTLNSSP